MQKIVLYRYIRPDGGVTVSPIKPECEYAELFRLIASDGCILTDGETYATCTDTNNYSAWDEVEETECGHDEATEDDYRNALREMGVEV